MNEISTNVKKYVVLTWNKGEYLIDERQHNIVLTMGLNDRIDIDGNVIYGKSISEVITIGEKNKRDNQIRDAINQDYYKDFTGSDKTIQSFSNERKKKALESMKNGFLKNFKNREIPKNAEYILKGIQFRIDTIDWEKSY